MLLFYVLLYPHLSKGKHPNEDFLRKKKKKHEKDVILQVMKRITCILALLWWVLLSTNAQSITEAESLFEQGDDFYEAHDYKSAKNCYQQSLNILEKCKATNLLLYFQILFELAEVADEENNFYAAVRYMERAMAVNNDTVRNSITRDEGVYTPKRKLSDYYAKAGMWEKAFDLKKQRIEDKLKMYKKRKDGVSDAKFDIVLEDYMNWIQNANYYKYAFRTIKKVQEHFNQSPYYDYWLGECYYNFNEYDKALDRYRKAKSNIGIAKVLAAKGDIKNALAIQKGVEEEKENRKHTLIPISGISGHDEPFSNYSSILASYYIQNGQYDKAIECEKQNKDNLFSLLNISRAYYKKQEWNKAKEYALRAYQLTSQERVRFLVLVELAKCSFSTNNIRELQNYISELIRCSGKELLSSFQELTYNERTRYIEEYSDLLNRQILTYAYYTHSNSIIKEAYNASLMMKGALLNSENGVKRVIEESKNDALKDLWAELKADRYILAKSLEKDSLYRKLNADSLQNVIYSLEDSLIVKCKEYGDITRSMKLKWDDIQKHLHTEDVAIEFLSFPINKDSTVYVALSLRKDSKCPKMIHLFMDKQLKQVPDTLYYQCREVADLIWKPLQAELEGIKNIYFSPSGALYNIGIEYLPGMEDYNTYRLSSTRELVTGGKTETKNRAVLYGGLRYDAGFDKSVTEKSIAILDEVFKERANVRGMGLRGGKEYLKHTKEEVDIIGEELGKLNWECVIDSAAMGTEESFKALSGRKIGCLHISTHGFYYTQEDADNARYKFMLIDNDMISAEDKALTRSGLVMSGANHILEDEELPDNVEDGILTAKEISDVDLRGLDLVVLSACQTGLGDIAQGEGVFGLQRGFKKAGANSILMSLWEVDDKAAQILMTQFYRNLLSGQSKRQSLLSAQKYLREVDGGRYDEPKYWAAFILLDAKDT